MNESLRSKEEKKLSSRLTKLIAFSKTEIATGSSTKNRVLIDNEILSMQQYLEGIKE